MAPLRKFFRAVREVNVASFPFVVVFAIAFRLASFLAPAWVTATFGATTRWVWALFLASIVSEILARLPRAFRLLRRTYASSSVTARSFRERAAWEGAAAAIRAQSLSKLFGCAARAVTVNGEARIIMYARRASVARLLFVVYLQLAATRVLAGVRRTTRFIQAYTPPALPFVLCILLAQLSPSLPESLRFSSRAIPWFAGVCALVVAIVAVEVVRGHPWLSSDQ